MQDIVSVLSALAELTRLAAMRLLWDGGEPWVCDVMRKIDASQSRMSRHMGVQNSLGWSSIGATRNGRAIAPARRP
jgi:ArsR family transcriptional regulator